MRVSRDMITLEEEACPGDSAPSGSRVDPALRQVDPEAGKARTGIEGTRNLPPKRKRVRTPSAAASVGASPSHPEMNYGRIPSRVIPACRRCASPGVGLEVGLQQVELNANVTPQPHDRGGGEDHRGEGGG